MTVDSDIAELASSIKQSLDASGGLSAIRAQLRAQVFGAMQISMPQLEDKPTLNPAAKLALGLIEEFLEFHNCNCTLSTAESEVSGWSERLPGGEVATATGFAKGDAPLLVQLVSAQLPGLNAQLIERRSAPQERRVPAEVSPSASPAASDGEPPSVAVSSPRAAASLRSRPTYPASGQPCAAAPPSRRVF